MADDSDEKQNEGLHSFFEGFFKKSYSLTLLIITAFGIFYTLMCDFGWGYASTPKKIICAFTQADKLRDNAINLYRNATPNTKAIANQYDYVNTLKSAYITTAETIGVHYYALVTVLIVASVASSIIVAVIARKGWKKQSPLIKAAFYGFFFCSSLPGVLVSTLNFSQNSSSNIDKYFYLTNLQTDIYNAITVDPPASAKLDKDSLVFKTFNDVNDNLKKNMNLFLDVKAENIPSTSDVNSELKKALGKVDGANKH
jgi:hypothetical protein